MTDYVNTSVRIIIHFFMHRKQTQEVCTRILIRYNTWHILNSCGMHDCNVVVRVTWHHVNFHYGCVLIHTENGEWFP